MAASHGIPASKHALPPFSPGKEKEASDETSPADSTEAVSPRPSGLALNLIVGSVMMAVFLTTLDQTIVSTAVPKITDELRGLEQVSWYGAVYFLTLGAFRPFWGKVCTYFPTKSTFILTVAIFELGSLICGLAPNPTAFIIGRAITGAGGAGIATGGTTMVALSASPRKRPLYMAFLGTAAALGNITGPLLGGVFSDKITWRWCFYINLPCGAIVVGFILIFLRHGPGATAINASWKQAILHMDMVGIILTLSGMVCFILALQYGGIAHPWKSSQVIGLLVGFVLIVGTLVVWELYQKEYAMLQWRLIKKRAIWTTCMFQFFFAGAYFVILYYLPTYFQSIRGASPLQSGVDNLPLVITFGAAMLAGGFAVAATGYATPFMAAGAVLTCVSAGLFFSMGIETPSAKWIGYQVLAGAAIAFPYMNCLSLAQAHVDDADISIVSSINQFFQTLGGAFSISAAQAAFINRLLAALTRTDAGIDHTRVTKAGAAELRNVFAASELPSVIFAYTEGLRAAFAVSIGVAGMAVLVSLLCPWSRLPTSGKGDGEVETEQNAA